MRALVLLSVALAIPLLGCSRGEPSPRPSRSARALASASSAPVAVPLRMSGGESESGTPSVVAAPSYDLATDRDRRVKAAKEELGSKAVGSTVADVFVVIGPPGWQGGRYEQSVVLMKNAMAGFMNGRFGRKPSEAISVYLFPTAEPYEAFCIRKYGAACIAHFGFYSPSDRYMVMNIGLGLGTLTHEIVHPLVEADFPGAPTWLNEGIASVFEQPQIPSVGEIHGGKNWRHPRLVKALTTRERDDARLDRLFGMRDDVFRGDHEDLHYAMARYACQWLDARGKLWPFYQRWRDDIANDPSGEKAFKEVVGMTPAEAHVVWSKWTLAL